MDAMPKPYLDSHWASSFWYLRKSIDSICEPDAIHWKTNTFIGLAAQFHILPYIKAKAGADSSVLVQPGTAKGIGIFESAVLGYDLFGRPSSQSLIREARMVTPIALRIKTVQYLLDQGVGQSDTYLQFPGSAPRQHDLKNLVSYYAALHNKCEGVTARELSEYYIAVGKLLSQHSRSAR
jgi:hypothetical protein